MSRRAMDSPKFNPHWTPEMPSEENSQGASAASQSISEALIKNLSNLTLNPSTKFSSLVPENPPQKQGGENIQRLDESALYMRRRRVRTLLTARKERMERMIQIIKYRYLNQLPQIRREGRPKDVGVESRMARFRCSCHYCLYHRDLSEDTGAEKNDSTENN